MKRVRLKNLRVMQQSPQLLRSGRKILWIHTDQLVYRFGRSEVVTDWTNSAEALHEDGCFPIRSTLDKSLETAELNDVEVGVLHFPVFVQVNGHPTVAFYARNRIDHYFGCHDQSYLNSEYSKE